MTATQLPDLAAVPAFQAELPPLGTSKAPTSLILQWEPGAAPGFGLATIHTRKGRKSSACRYVVAEMAPSVNGRVFRFHKSKDDPGYTDETATYDAVFGGGRESCGCWGSTRWAGQIGRCKHLRALARVLEVESCDDADYQI